MTRLVISGGLLLVDALAQWGLAWNSWSEGIGGVGLALGAGGLLWSANRFASELFASLTGQQ